MIEDSTHLTRLFSLRTARGTRVLISNADPTAGRRVLHVSSSADGRVFTRMARLGTPFPRPSTLQYPHAIEHDGHLFVTFSRDQAAIEVVRLRVADVELAGPGQ